MVDLSSRRTTWVSIFPILSQVAFLIILIMLKPSGQTWAQDQVVGHNGNEIRRDFNTTLGLDLSSLVSNPNLLILGVAGVASAFTRDEVDEHQGGLRRSLDESGLDGLMDLGNLYGSGWFVGGVSMGVVAAGGLGDNEGLRRFGIDLGRSFVYSAVATMSIKLVVNRTRPSGGPYSFPSGHTTSAFSTVPVVWHHVGWVAGMGVGTLACLTAMGRMEDNRHYASDVVFGAGVGLVFGRAVISQCPHADWLDHLAVSDRSVAVGWVF